ncbi:Pimeloyl-ACP methyl ester carboxylesterase [Promicromonospora umidemergens]|uniref:Alpha/beta hydrolase n=1 Tax=Promicromonospora umidemergens TaxID=629679 RepID=A0ABP8WC32_9MICO|nr:alpha/beta hydrolase [Promicromonospora umidemergens]MCP2284376.1 Pimeloyl-ACP methyl ester carboxylesterase [Promicromonospora umidemergens]
MRALRFIGKTLAGLLATALVLIGGFTGYHHIMLRHEASELEPVGQMTTVDEHQMSVSGQGPKNDEPTIVLISGAGTAAPIYAFKPLTDRLDDEFRTVVVERFGYGYSDTVDADRDVAAVLENTREALRQAGEKPPYVLAAHSMGGLEALYWAQTYPNEVAGVVGLDMSVPHSYDSLDFEAEKATMDLGRKLKLVGLSRVLGGDDLTAGLDGDQIAQQEMLTHRNFLNDTLYAEGLALLDNAATVQAGDMPDDPMLMFVSDGEEIGDFWVPANTEFADQAGAELVQLDVGHYVFQYEPDLIAQQTAAFIETRL